MTSEREIKERADKFERRRQGCCSKLMIMIDSLLQNVLGFHDFEIESQYKNLKSETKKKHRKNEKKFKKRNEYQKAKRLVS
jgi:hypothetical protein